MTDKIIINNFKKLTDFLKETNLKITYDNKMNKVFLCENDGVEFIFTKEKIEFLHNVKIKI